MSRRKTLTTWLKSRFLLIVRDEDNFAVKKSYRFSRAYLIGLSSLVLLVVVLLSFLFTETIIPAIVGKGDSEMTTNMRMLEISETVDSLANQIEARETYIANLRRIFQGQDIGIDDEMILSISPTISGSNREIVESPISEVDSLFRREVEESDFGLISLGITQMEELMDLYFFPPVNGIISAPFDLKSDHFGVDIVSKKNDPIKSIADGTVIMASWTQDSGYTIAIQHRGNLISIYKHNAVLLKKVGNFVSAGETIAIIGNSGELTDGPHLHLEIWHNGSPLDPEQIISF